MSRRYSIRLTGGAFHLLKGKDMVMTFVVSPVTCRKRIIELVKAGLEKRGALPDLNGKLLLIRESGVRLSIDLADCTIVLDLSGALDGKAATSVFEELLPRELRKAHPEGSITLNLEQLRQIDSKIAGQLVGDIEAEARRIAITEGIAARNLINETLRDAYRDAILERAQEMGSVVSVTEDKGQGTYRLRLEIS